MNRVAVIIPTTGADSALDAVKSVLNQDYDDVMLYLVVDGKQNERKFRANVYDHISHNNKSKIRLNVLDENVGSNGFYGHRIYAAFTHLVNSKYILYLDQDCWYDRNHVSSLVNTIKCNDSDWSYSLRKIVDKEGKYICNDDCESLGKWNPVMQYNHIDTNCYCIKTDIAVKVCHIWHGGWGTDRVFYNALSHYFKSYDCSKEYTLNYRLDGNEGSVKPEFFLHWNNVVSQNYRGNCPWQK